MKTLQQREIMKQFVIILLGVFAVYGVIWCVTGVYPWSHTSYNSYTLQAKAWLEGRLDLGQNYEYLELAIFNGKYYVSFPPFPSYIFFVLGLIFQSFNFDGFVALLSTLVGAWYVLRLLHAMKKNNPVFWTLFLMIAQNLVFVSSNGWVWFIAQNLSFTLSIMAIYYAYKGAGGFSFFFWACSVGCRPFQVIYFPFLVYLVFKQYKKENPSATFFGMAKSKYYWAIPTFLVAFSYMVLNYARFGSITEFGHNYLPEFVNAENGQFHISYIFQNWVNLFRLYTHGANGEIEYCKFNGMALFVPMPIYISYVWYLLYYKWKRSLKDYPLLWIHMATMLVHILLTLSHKTLGGWQFGNRYFIDLLPYVFFVFLYATKDENDPLEQWQLPLFIFGIVVNVVGAIVTYNNWV